MLKRLWMRPLLFEGSLQHRRSHACCARAPLRRGRLSRWRLTLWTSTQVPHYVHRALSRVLELPMDRIRVIKPAVGGGFGGKGEPVPLEFAVSLLAMRRAARQDRARSRRVFPHPRGRHPYRMSLCTGVSADGLIRAVSLTACWTAAPTALSGLPPCTTPASC